MAFPYCFKIKMSKDGGGVGHWSFFFFDLIITQNTSDLKKDQKNEETWPPYACPQEQFQTIQLSEAGACPRK